MTYTHFETPAVSHEHQCNVFRVSNGSWLNTSCTEYRQSGDQGFIRNVHNVVCEPISEKVSYANLQYIGAEDKVKAMRKQMEQHKGNHHHHHHGNDKHSDHHHQHQQNYNHHQELGLPGVLDEHSAPVPGLPGVVDEPLAPVQGLSGAVDEPLGPAQGLSSVGDESLAPVQGLSGVVDKPSTPVQGLSSVGDEPLAPVQGLSGVVDEPLTPVPGLPGVNRRHIPEQGNLINRNDRIFRRAYRDPYV